MPSAFFLLFLFMPSSISTQNESSLHRELKLIYTGRGGQTEVETAGFVVDGVNADGACIEVQGRNFGGAFMGKVAKLAALGNVKVVYPVIIAKYLEVFDEEGTQQYRRKSGRRGSVWDVFFPLIYAPEMPLVPGLEIELALVDVAERRVRDGKGSWRRRGVSIRDRKLLALHESVTLKRPADYLRFVPFAKNLEFTSGDLAAQAGIRVELARKTLYVLARLGIVEKTGRKGNRLVYRLRVSSGTKKWKKPPKQ